MFTQYQLQQVVSELYRLGLVAMPTQRGSEGGGGAFTGVRAGCYDFPTQICVDAKGRITSITAGTEGETEIVIQDEGVVVGERRTLNFVGAGVTAADDPGNDRVNVTIPGGVLAGTPGMAFGDNSVTATTTTRYLNPWYEDATAETNGVTNARIIAWRAGTLRDLFVKHGNPNGNNNAIVYTVRVNGIATALTVSLGSNTAGPASDLANSVAVVQGDEIDIEVTKALSIGSSPNNITAQMEFA